MTKGVILLSAGGTGGHLFPAEALARELTKRGWRIHLATDERAERFSGEFPADKIHVLRSATFGSRNPFALAKSAWTLWSGFRQARRLIAELKPVAAVGFGGYPTVPPLVAAARAKVPVVLHEANAVLGRANRYLEKRATAVATGFALASQNSAHTAKTFVTGNPVRPEILKAARGKYQAPEENGPFKLLVFGGSQGARFFSEILPQAIDQLPADLAFRLRIVQQAREEDAPDLRVAYDQRHIEARVAPFFTNMAEHIANAHLVISRAGAGTVSEIAVIGRPSILVPYPHALDHDQVANAATLAERDGAIIVKQADLSAEKLAGMITSAINNPKMLATQAKNAKKAGARKAAKMLADMVEHIASRKPVDTFEVKSK